MSTVFLNGQFMPLTEAKISPLDRGFLFGDGIYEVIPSYQAGRFVGFNAHIERLQSSLKNLQINLDYSLADWRQLCQQLIEKNQGDDLAVYIQVSRGADLTRSHAYPEDLEPTVFAFSFAIAPEKNGDLDSVKPYKLISTEDKRWRRCNIKSTALLGNIMHYQQGVEAEVNEVLLYNQNNELTEASSSNIYIVKESVIVTPALSHELLPGITRQLLLKILTAESGFNVEERSVSIEEARAADEIWLTSSSREITPVIELDGTPVGEGKVGPVWQCAMRLFAEKKYQF